MPTTSTTPSGQRPRRWDTSLPDPGNAVVNLIEIVAADQSSLWAKGFPAGGLGEAKQRELAVQAVLE
jgi:hypothetical protein